MTFLETISLIFGAGFGTGIVTFVANLIGRRRAARAEQASGRSKTEDALLQASKLLTHANIMLMADKYMHDGRISPDNLRNLDALHKIYHDEFDGNGLVKRRMAEVHTLPVLWDSVEVSLKAHKASGAATPQPLITPRPLATILCVDDEAISRKQVHNVFQGRYKMHILSDPKNTKEFLLYETPDIIILDHVMPDMTGLDLIPVIRAIPAHKTTPIILLTGDESEEVRAEALRLGVAAVLYKTGDYTALKETVAKLLGGVKV